MDRIIRNFEIDVPYNVIKHKTLPAHLIQNPIQLVASESSSRTSPCCNSHLWSCCVDDVDEILVVHAREAIGCDGAGEFAVRQRISYNIMYWKVVYAYLSMNLAVTQNAVSRPGRLGYLNQ
jgi:hypothetical protein